MNLTVPSVNLQKWWSLFEECWQIFVQVCRILMHREHDSSLILSEGIEISKYYKNKILNFSEDMTFFIPSYLSVEALFSISYYIQWNESRFVENHLCSVQARFPRIKFVSGCYWFKNFLCAILLLDIKSLDCLLKHLEF